MKNLGLLAGCLLVAFSVNANAALSCATEMGTAPWIGTLYNKADPAQEISMGLIINNMEMLYHKSPMASSTGMISSTCKPTVGGALLLTNTYYGSSKGFTAIMVPTTPNVWQITDLSTTFPSGLKEKHYAGKLYPVDGGYVGMLSKLLK